MIKSKIDSFPAGSYSESNHYWCVTCKKFFVLDKPECPYMTGMCVNTPIAIENFHPENTEALEKFGLFYPKIPQRILAGITAENLRENGKKFAQAYLDFLKEWKFENGSSQPLQSIKSFIIVLSGCETAQRINEDSVTFVLMDAEKIWKKPQIREILEGALETLKAHYSLERELHIDFIDILGEREVGKYFCAKCGMFFEFGMKRDKVTCPLMAQKCMFDPQHIDNVRYESYKLLKQFEITPDIYTRMFRALGRETELTSLAERELTAWRSEDKADGIAKILGSK